MSAYGPQFFVAKRFFYAASLFLFQTNYCKTSFLSLFYLKS